MMSNGEFYEQKQEQRAEDIISGLVLPDIFDGIEVAAIVQGYYNGK